MLVRAAVGRPCAPLGRRGARFTAARERTAFAVPPDAENRVTGNGEIGVNQALAEQLYATGNFDAMHFAGMIADPKAMHEADSYRWMEAAHFPMLSDVVVAVGVSYLPLHRKRSRPPKR